jgi:hypothetical protein
MPKTKHVYVMNLRSRGGNGDVNAKNGQKQTPPNADAGESSA